MANPNPRLVKAIRRRGGKHAALLLATAIVESGGRLDAVGDGGMSIGPYQMHSRGRGYGVPPAKRMDPDFSTESAAAEFNRFAAKGLRGAELAYAAQRPADRAGYIAKINAALPEAQRILGQSGGPARTAQSAGRAVSPRDPGAGPSSPVPGSSVPGLSPQMGRDLMTLLNTAEKGALLGKMPDEAYSMGLGKISRALQEQAKAAAAAAVKTPGTISQGRPAPGLGGSPVQFSMGGGPSAHAGRALGDWQSDNAYDLMGKAGDPVYAPIQGVVTRISGAPGSPRGAQFAGYGITVKTAEGNLFFKHLGKSNVKVGDRITPGSVIGTLDGTTQGGPHLHLGSDNSKLGARLAKWYTSAPRSGAPMGQSAAAPLTPGGGWGGTEKLILDLVRIAGVPKGMYSGKRSQPSAVAGTRSDHYVGNKNAYASDISFGSQTPTPTGDAYASRIVEALGGPKNWGKRGGNWTKTINGFRYQVIYRSQVGGNHNNHVHVGVHRA